MWVVGKREDRSGLDGVSPYQVVRVAPHPSDDGLVMLHLVIIRKIEKELQKWLSRRPRRTINKKAL